MKHMYAVHISLYMGNGEWTTIRQCTHIMIKGCVDSFDIFHVEVSRRISHAEAPERQRHIVSSSRWSHVDTLIHPEHIHTPSFSLTPTDTECQQRQKSKADLKNKKLNGLGMRGMLASAIHVFMWFSNKFVHCSIQNSIRNTCARPCIQYSIQCTEESSSMHVWLRLCNEPA